MVSFELGLSEVGRWFLGSKHFSGLSLALETHGRVFLGADNRHNCAETEKKTLVLWSHIFQSTRWVKQTCSHFEQRNGEKEFVVFWKLLASKCSLVEYIATVGRINPPKKSKPPAWNNMIKKICIFIFVYIETPKEKTKVKKRHIMQIYPGAHLQQETQQPWSCIWTLWTLEGSSDSGKQLANNLCQLDTIRLKRFLKKI